MQKDVVHNSTADLIKRFHLGMGLDFTQTLAMLAMAYQVRPVGKKEDRDVVGGNLYVIPDICMGRSNGYEEYRVSMPGYLLDESKLNEESFDEYLSVSLDVAEKYLIWLHKLIFARYNNVGLVYFDDLVSKSSFVLPEYRAQFAKGLYYGYVGDYHTAACLIIPIIERCIKKVCCVNKIEIKNKNGDELGLGQLLNKKDAMQLFSKGVYFEYKAIFAAKKGLNLRNMLMHGAITDEQAKGIECFYMWWFALRIAVTLKICNRETGELAERHA